MTQMTDICPSPIKSKISVDMNYVTKVLTKEASTKQTETNAIQNNVKKKNKNQTLSCCDSL